MFFLRARVVLVVSLLAVCFVRSVRSEPAAPRRAVTIEDLLNIRNGFDAQLSADGRFVAFAIMEPADPVAADKGPVSNLWIVPAAGSGAPVRLTAGARMDWLPRWAPDSERIAYLSPGQDVTRVYVTSRAQKTPAPVTPPDLDVSDFAWSPDGRTIAFLSSEDAGQTDYVNHPFPNADEQVLSRKVVVSRLLAVDVSTRRVRPVTHEPLSILGFAWSPDGQSIALQIPKSAMLQSFPVSSADPIILGVVPSQGGAIMNVAELSGAVGVVRWSPDGSTIAVPVYQGKAVSKFPNRIALVSMKEQSASRYLLKGYNGSLADFAWLRGGKSIVFSGIEGTKTRLRLVDVESDELSAAFLREGAMEDISVSDKHLRIAYFDESPHHPRDLWISELDGPSRQLTRLNPQIDKLLFGDVEVIHWKAQDGIMIEGLLLKPAGLQAGHRYPLVVMPHGGVTGWSRWKSGFLTDVGQVMAAGHGFAVLYPNPRGTPGYGTGFEDGLVGDVGGHEVTDILSGIDFLVQEGIADPQKLGIGGWSWGGTIAVSAISQTNRFKCAIDGGGVVDWISFFGQSDSPAIATSLFGGTPLDHPDLYRERSPIFHLSGVTTPLLVLHGEEDTHVPTGQAWEIYRLLKAERKRVEFVIYPREKEYLLEPAHAFNFMSRVLDWYERHLKDDAAPAVAASGQQPPPANSQ